MEAQRKERDAQSTLDEIAAFLPAESAAAVKQLSSNPFTILAIILYFIGAASAAVGGLATAYRALIPSDPPPQTIINNYGPIFNHSTPGNGAENSISQPLSRAERRRIQKAERNDQEVERKRTEKAARKRRLKNMKVDQ